MDIELMRRLSPRVNVIPVIGKADSLTPSELKGFKKRVKPSYIQRYVTTNNTHRSWKTSSIMISRFIIFLTMLKRMMKRPFKIIANCAYVESLLRCPLSYVLQALLPFAVIGSEEEIEIDGQPVRARIYPWGIAEVDNPKHSDFSRLRSALLKSV